MYFHLYINILYWTFEIVEIKFINNLTETRSIKYIGKDISGGSHKSVGGVYYNQLIVASRWDVCSQLSNITAHNIQSPPRWPSVAHNTGQVQTRLVIEDQASILVYAMLQRESV